MSDYLPPIGRLGCLLPGIIGALMCLGVVAVAKLALVMVLRWR